MRSRVLDGLVATSARSDALTRLTVGDRAADEVARNTRLRELPAGPALEIYAGVLYDALGAASLSAAAKRRARSRVVVVSSLFGLLRPTDHIPPYRLPICADLVDVDGLERSWRPVVGPALAAAAGPAGVIVDCRSSSYLAVGTASGLASRTAVLRVVRDATDGRSVGAHVGKRVRGEVARHLLELGADPQTPAGLGEALAERWTVAVTPPASPTRPWTVDIVAFAH